MSANLRLLGITPELIRVMEQERKGPAPWLHDDNASHESRIRTGVGSRRYKLRSIKVGQTRVIVYDDRSPEALCNSLTSCVTNVRKKYGMKFKTHRTKRGVEVTRIV